MGRRAPAALLPYQGIHRRFHFTRGSRCRRTVDRNGAGFVGRRHDTGRIVGNLLVFWIVELLSSMRSRVCLGRSFHATVRMPFEIPPPIFDGLSVAVTYPVVQTNESARRLRFENSFI